jgi:hypothetical protein
MVGQISFLIKRHRKRRTAVALAARTSTGSLLHVLAE